MQESARGRTGRRGTEQAATRGLAAWGPVRGVIDKKHRGADEQEEVLDEKDHVIESPSRGLQQYGEEAFPDGQTHGSGSAGTAERAAKITAAQQRKEKEQPERG